MSMRWRKTGQRLSEPVGERRTIVAAVCFRRRNRQVMFRLVPTEDGSQWNFPAGEQRPSESLLEAARRHASEQAGVTGVVDEKPLSEYRHPGHKRAPAIAFLTAVQSVGPISGPAWFDIDTTLDKLAEGRDPREAQELRRVLIAAEKALRDSRRRAHFGAAAA